MNRKMRINAQKEVRRKINRASEKKRAAAPESREETKSCDFCEAVAEGAVVVAIPLSDLEAPSTLH